AAINEFLASEITKHFLLQWLQRCLLVCISREERKRKGDPIPVHEKPHLDDRVRSVFLPLPIFLAAVFLFNLKIIIRAVVITDLIIPLPHEMAVFIGLRLDQITFSPKDIQRTVYIVKLVGWFF